jgi:hypothetical protein
MKKCILLLALALSMIACSTVTRYLPKTPSGDLESEEQAVYSIVLAAPPGKILVLSDTTQSGFDYLGNTRESTKYIRNSMPTLSGETLESYLKRNDQSYPLPADMDLGREYRLINDEEKNGIFGSDAYDGWDEFYRRYPDASGSTTVSKVGFNRNLSEALVYVGSQSAPLAGTGNLIRLEKKDGVWKVMDMVMLWIS